MTVEHSLILSFSHNIS